MNTHIANMAYCHPSALPDAKWKQMGRLYLCEGENIFIRLSGWRQGEFVAKPFSNIESPPFIRGDIVARIKDFDPTTNKPFTQWCGFIYSDDNQNGDPIYRGRLEIMPYTQASKSTIWGVLLFVELN